MQLTPRYDDAPVIRIDLDLGDVAATLAQQRRRLVAELSTLEPAQWAHPTRCDDWTVTDVVAHLAGTTRFWNASISGGAAGTPTRYLDGFDPATTPGDLVAGMGELSPEVALEMLDETGEALVTQLDSLDTAGWSALAEAPPGHLRTTEVALHALWDAWIHERDILIPLGRPAPAQPDEMRSTLAYVAALSPAIERVTGGPNHVGSMRLRSPDLDTSFIVDVADAVVVLPDDDRPCTLSITGKAIDLIEALSCRSPALATPPEDTWLVSGLSRLFDQTR